jgi:hypothetical protein
MCRVELCEPWRVHRQETRTARAQYRCVECGRAIRRGEAYICVTGLGYDAGRWATFRTCRHCDALADWLRAVCGGYVYRELHEELEEHWHEGYRSIALGRLIAAMRHRWREGQSPVPEGVTTLAKTMMQDKVSEAQQRKAP